MDVELSELLRRRLGPTTVTEQVWEEGLGEVLRLSGLFVQSGKHFDYLHKTFQEYFAAARLARDHGRPTVRKLFPRARWPWPDTQIRVFLAARWAEADHDLGPVLRTLLWWPYTASNVGFLAELVNHGVPLPEDVARKASRWLEATLSTTAGGAAWQERARWFHDIDPVGAVTALRLMVLDRTKGQDGKFEALRFLIDVVPADVIDLALVFLSHHRVGARAKLTVGSLLYRRDPAAGMALFNALADAEDGEARFLALLFLAPHAPERALDVARRIVTATDMTDDQRFSAAREAARLDYPRGTDLMCDVIRLAVSDPIREAAMEFVRTADQDRLTALCEELSADKTGNPDLRFATTMYLVKRLGRPTSRLTDLVADRDFPPEKRVTAALVDGGGAAKRILKDVVESFAEDDRRRLWAIEQLMVVSTREAAQYLAALVRNERQKPPARLQAVMLISKHVPLAELMQLFAVLVKSPTLSDDDRLTAAKKAMTVERGEGKKLVLSIAENRAVARDLRMKAAAALGKAGERQAEFAAYRAIAVDDALPDTFCINAAIAARRALRAEGDVLISSLVRTRMRGKPRMELIDALNERNQSVLLEQFAGDAGETSALRFAAAKRLLAVDPAMGKRAMARLADDRKMPDRLRAQAREASE